MTSLIDLVYVSGAVETFFIFNVNFLKPGTKVPIHNLKIHFHLPPMKISSRQPFRRTKIYTAPLR